MVKPLTFEYPALGYDLICFSCYQYIGDLDGKLKIEPVPVKFGEHTFVPNQTNVVQIGDERDTHALWTMLRLEGGFSLLYLGTFQADKGIMLMFQPLINNKPPDFQRNLFGLLADCNYVSLFVAFNFVNEKELLITTSAHAPRLFRPTVVFAENSLNLNDY